jgi:hypothetical protein
MVSGGEGRPVLGGTNCVCSGLLAASAISVRLVDGSRCLVATGMLDALQAAPEVGNDRNLQRVSTAAVAN